MTPTSADPDLLRPQVDEIAPAAPDRMDERAREVELFARIQRAFASGNPAAARDGVLTLLRDHPSSLVLPFAMIAMADDMFARGEIEPALLMYTKAAMLPGDHSSAYAQYRMAWCHLGQGDTTKALDMFVKVIRTSDDVSRSGRAPDGLVRLGTASRRDALYAYAKAGQPKKAPMFFKAIGGRNTGTDDVGTLVRMLAELYREQGAEQSRIDLCAAASAEDIPCRRDLRESRPRPRRHCSRNCSR